MKKKIAIVLGGAMIGGVEMALKRMLKVIDTAKYEVFLFTNIEGNPCIENLNDKVHVINIEIYDLRNSFLDAVRKGETLLAGRLLSDYVNLKLAKNEAEKTYWSARSIPLSNVYFDCAIAYKQGDISVVGALFRLKAKKRVLWIHGALKPVYTASKRYRKWIGTFDKVFCVSEVVKRNTEKTFPMIKGKTEVIYNIIDCEEIREKARVECAKNKDITLVTVGRLSPEKGQDMIPQVAKYLKDAGYKFKWYIVGDGPLRVTVEEKCREYDVTENIIFTGTQGNPYPYIKNCDVYIQTSYSEGYCTTTMEAKILGKPIVTTDAPGMREQFVSGVNGLIVESMTPAALFEGIKSLLDDPTLSQKFIDALKEEKHDNSKELEKLYAFIES